MRKTVRELNLLELTPRRNAGWERDEQGRVVILVPKFRNPLLVRWVMPMLSKPNFRVKLDAFGSFVWDCCDGRTTVEEIGRRMRKEFGESSEPVYERIGAFLKRLDTGELIVVGERMPTG